MLLLIKNRTITFSETVNILKRDKGQVSRALSSLKKEGLVE
ncbi:MAG: ArsR family transcriptional regulator [Candidatus Lokiarchaeota archaeon]|nr:ArsR family transcriptional regulator [Candidatus Lokiarchaeota archaeon]